MNMHCGSSVDEDALIVCVSCMDEEASIVCVRAVWMKMH